MTGAEFRDLAVFGSDAYYRFLTDAKKGRNYVFVSRIVQKGDIFSLYLENALRSPEQACIEDSRFPSSSQPRFSVVGYSQRERILHVRPSPEYAPSFASAKPSELRVFSDMRFLVRRVKDWYEKNGGALALPTSVSEIQTPGIYTLGASLSDSQNNAVELAFSSPLCYIWGAPGTGKTRYVLAECVLRYISGRQPVLIAAPTNDALDQTLFAVLDALKASGLSSDLSRLVFRVGVASPKFAAAYPELCERYSTGEFTAELNAISDHLYSITSQEYLQLFRQYQSANKEYSALSDRYEEVKADLEYSKSQIKPVVTALLNLDNYRISVEAEIQRIDLKLSKPFVLRRKREAGKKTALKNSLFDISVEASRLRERASFWREEAEKQELQCEITRKHLYELKSRMDSINKRRDQLAGELEMLKQTCSPGFDDQSDFSSSVDSRFSGLTKDELYARLNETKSHLENLEEYNEGRLLDSLVVAATVDTCISRLGPSSAFEPRHVFLDEAAYCPLVKSASLLWYTCPLTMLGDHMQLPPVCELPPKEINAASSLWDQSALFVADAFRCSPDELLELYKDTRSVPNMPTAFLTTSFRYGDTIAAALSSFVYKSSGQILCGNSNVKTSVFYIDAPKEEPLQTRESKTEIYATRSLSRHIRNENFIILVPYNRQKDAMKRLSPELSEKVKTIHKAQGQEWDIVIFSVVDTSDKFFVDSSNPKSNGLKLINTAISRAKKEIVFVCDYDYWSLQSDQLIGKMLSIAQRLDVPNESPSAP